jgi:thioredoxin reductase
MVMTRPVRLPIHGRLSARRIRKEKLLTLWRGIADRNKLEFHYGQRVRRIVRRTWGFDVETQSARYATRTVLLATGRRGTPRTLDVPGEDGPNVAYRLAEPARYAGRRVVVVGGGDSAIEAALTLARRGDVAVTLMHRGERFERAKPANIDKLTAAEADSRLAILREAAITSIAIDSVSFTWRGRPHALPNDAVIVCIGGRLPTELLQDIGVEVETRYGTP